MAKDILSIKQLEEQLKRRRERLRIMEEGRAPEAAIAIARKDLLLTQRRLQRAREMEETEQMFES